MVYFTHFTAQTLELDCYWDVLSYRHEICDMIKGNESLVENFNFNFVYTTFSKLQNASF